MKDHDDIRSDVSQAYAKAVSAPATTGCCRSALPKGNAARMVGYDGEELDALPGDAVTHSFGCGNPLAFSEVKAGDTVVDLGSGAGIDLLIAARKVGSTGRVIGVDMTDEMIVKARENIKVSGCDNVEVRKGIIEKLPVEDSSADWVISNCVINLSPDKPAVFREIARVLKPGGRMSVSDIVVHDLPDWARKDSALYSGCVAGAVSEEEYLDGLRQAGLTDVEVQGRLVYEAAQLDAMFEADPIFEAGASRSSGCCGTAPQGETVSCTAKELAGKVQSIKVHARKPTASCQGKPGTQSCCGG